MSKQAWSEDLRLVKSVIEAWDAHSRIRDPSAVSDSADLFRQQFEQFQQREMVKALGAFETRKPPSVWTDLPGFLPGAPVSDGTPMLFPLARIGMRVSHRRLELGVRLVTYFVDPDGDLDAFGWRFDCGDPNDRENPTEPGTACHPFPHVQRINAWTLKGAGFWPESWSTPHPGHENLASHHPKWHETRPAFPLPSNTAVGILIAAMTSLYSATTTRRILENVTKTTQLERVLNAVLDGPAGVGG